MTGPRPSRRAPRVAHLPGRALSGAMALGLALALTGPAAGPAAAQSALRNAELSARLYEQAVDLGDPVLAIAAARLRKSVFAMQTERHPVKSGPPPEGALPMDRLVTWQDMLAAAEEMANGNEAVLQLASNVRFVGTKGVSSGQVYSIAAIGAGASDSYPPLEYLGGAYAEVYVEAQDSTADLNIFVRDAQGRLVCSDTDISAIAYCGWRPAVTERFTVEVTNHSAVASSYSLITN